MDITSAGQTGVAALLQRILASQQAQSTQAVDGISAPTGAVDPANGAGSPLGSPPPKPDDGAASLLSSDTLSSVLSQQGPFSTAAAGSSTGSSALDTNKDGTVSQDELKAALDSLNASGQASSARPAGHRHHHHHAPAAASQAADATAAPTAGDTAPAAGETASAAPAAAAA